jgi:hypothetical protein
MISGIMYMTGGGVATPLLRHKHIRIDQRKLERAKRVLAASTDTEALDRALTLVVSEAALDATLRRARAKAKITKVFR